MNFTWIPETHTDEDRLVGIICNTVLQNTCPKDKYRNIRLFVYNNRFLSDDIKNGCYDLLGRILKRKRIFRRLIYAWMKKKFVFKNNCDLLLNPLNDSVDYVSIRRGNIVWRFTRNDIVNLFQSKLMSCAFQIPCVHPIANPYTNELLTKTELYNLYIGISDHKNKHWLIREFARLDFDEVVFLSEHRSYLYKNAVKQEIYEMDDENFRDSSVYLMQRFVGGRFISHGYFFVGLDSVSIASLRSIFTPLLIRYTEYHRESNGSFTFIMDGLCSFIETYPWIYKNVMKKVDRNTLSLRSEVIRECMKNTGPIREQII